MAMPRAGPAQLAVSQRLRSRRVPEPNGRVPVRGRSLASDLVDRGVRVSAV